MNYRKATLSDYQNIAKLHTLSWQENYQSMMAPDYLNNKLLVDKLAIWENRLKTPSPQQFILLAEKNSILCGFICVIANNNEKYGSIIDNLHINKTNKGQGIGTALIKQSALWLNQEHPESQVYLEVLVGNNPAIAFYQSLGAIKKHESIWLSPCGNHINEYIFSWESPKSLL